MEWTKIGLIGIWVPNSTPITAKVGETETGKISNHRIRSPSLLGSINIQGV